MSETDREKKEKKRGWRWKKNFKSNFPKQRRMGKCITTKFNFLFFAFSSFLIAYIRVLRLEKLSSEIVGDRDDCAVGAVEVNTPTSLCTKTKKWAFVAFCESPDSTEKHLHYLPQSRKTRQKQHFAICSEMQRVFHLIPQHTANNMLFNSYCARLAQCLYKPGLICFSSIYRWI